MVINSHKNEHQLSYWAAFKILFKEKSFVQLKRLKPLSEKSKIGIFEITDRIENLRINKMSF
jgi:hypothetical protein